MQGRLVIDEIRSECLEGNLPGDPTTRQVPIYLPPSYDRDTGRQFAVIYTLAGYTGAGRSFLNYNCWSPTLPERVEALICDGRMPEVIVVMPDCMTAYGGGQYLNSSALGRYQDFLADEVVSHVDHAYRTIAHRDSRAVVGKSSGGYGALVLGMQRADRFGVVGCHAGDMYFEYCYLPDIPKAAAVISQHRGLVAFRNHFNLALRKKGADFTAMSIVAMAAAYSPHPNAQPYGFDLPFDESSSEFREDVWLRWLAHDPVRMLERREAADALKSLRLLYLDVGTQDEYNLQLGARIFRDRLDRAGVAHVYEEFNDGHRDTGYRYDVSLPALARALEGNE
ncbi:MAG: esterase [Armatimonadetes bacterium]|nr:esterase [Armatimonadota bacterium]MBM4437681.1 esterase [Actinomycetota bacterium]